MLASAAPVRPEDEDHDEAEMPEPPPEGSLDSLQNRLGAAPWWIISGAFHTLLLMLITLIGLALVRTDGADTVIVTDLTRKEEPPEVEGPVKRDILTQPIDLPETEIETEEPNIITHEEVEIADHVETADDSDAADARGDNGISDVFLGGTGTVAAIGLGGGGGGAFGRPNGAGGRLRRAMRGGGGKNTESAVDAAVAWLARHQEQDGHWDVEKYEGGKVVCGGRGYDEGISGMALLAFLGAGHTSRIGKHKDVVRKAQDWIMSKQLGSGAFAEKRKTGYDIYDTALCTIALRRRGAGGGAEMWMPRAARGTVTS